MSSEIYRKVEQILSEQMLPGSGIPLLALVQGSKIEAMKQGGYELSLQLGIPLAGVSSTLAEQLMPVFEEAGLGIESIILEQAIPSAQAGNHEGKIEGVKNIIAVASGKGGVGKSTTTVNLALALVREGARVGILDADIYGPSQTHMLGLIDKRPRVLPGNRVVPLSAYDVDVISMGNLITEDTPVIWRGPMVSGALQQLLGNTNWLGLDYLLIDMPPGTGDIALTLAQRVPVSGSVIVTTPQDIALIDAKKGIEMFRKVNIPVFGVVENMAVHVCSNCGHEEHIFGDAGGQKLAEQYQVPVLGSLPLDLRIREQADNGKPTVVQEPESAIAESYYKIARLVAAECCMAANRQMGPEIVIEE